MTGGPPSLSTIELARRLRLHALRMTSAARSSHIGSCLSIADILAVLYGTFLRFRPTEPGWPDRDRLIVSKGHAAAIVYAAVAEAGFFPVERLASFGLDGETLAGHVTHSGNPGIEISSGSLGHGLSIAAGIALHRKRLQCPGRAVALLSDGECDEGSTWEAALFAPHHGLDNLIGIVDYNKIQSFGRVDTVLALEPLADKWRAFGWHVQEIDGHGHEALEEALAIAAAASVPAVLIAHTIKGKGVSFMEDSLAWHYRSASPEQLLAAIAEVEAG
jgi:transketolase